MHRVGDERQSKDLLTSFAPSIENEVENNKEREKKMKKKKKEKKKRERRGLWKDGEK